MNIVLIYENYKFILTEECPLELAANISHSVREAYDHWIQANNKSCYYMLAVMSDVHRIKCKKIETAYKIMESLQAMFGQPFDQSRHNAFKAVMNAKMKARTSVRGHVLKMIKWLNEVEIHGAIINERTQVSMILESLSHAFLPFKEQLCYEQVEL